MHSVLYTPPKEPSADATIESLGSHAAAGGDLGYRHPCQTLCSKTVWAETQLLVTAVDAHQLLAGRFILGPFLSVSGCSILCSALEVPKASHLQEDESQENQGLFLLKSPAGKPILVCPYVKSFFSLSAFGNM